MLQNKFILGTVSALIVMFGAIFVVQPSVAHADAVVQMRPENGELAIFGTVDLTNGQPEQGVSLLVGENQVHGRHDTFRVFDSTRTGSNGTFTLWVTNHEAGELHGDNLTLVLRPADNVDYTESLPMKPGEIASVTITMRTPLLPIFPFVTFIY